MIQIKGEDKSYRLLRGGEEEKFYNEDKAVFEQVNLPKKGFRRIRPFRKGHESEDFGAPSYLVVDKKRGRVRQKKVMKNPFFRTGRGHGVRFARAINADEVNAKNIGRNAKKALRHHGIKFK